MRGAEQARAYLERNPLLYMDMLEALRRGTSDLLYAEENGVLLWERVGDTHMASARDQGALERMLALLPECGAFVGHELWYNGYVTRRYGLHTEQICYQAAWMEPEPPEIPDFGGRLELLGQEWAQYVYDHYSHPFGGVAYIQRAIGRGMMGAFVDGTLAGFAGFHAEGAIGMLEVLPAYRRQGLGNILLRAVVRLALERGQYAFGQIIEDNEPSLVLHRRAGLTISEEKFFWRFN